MKREICIFIYNVILSVVVVFLGVFITKLVGNSFISFMEYKRIIISLSDIFYISIKIGLVGGGIGGIGIWLMYRFNIR
ncbi:hypothetical protein [Rahnella aceris]|jgi:hypothetical protein|uniref:Uncharacterized protein n=1 Tax=Rahnella sp. (strain Y9602) TaxID=2703885 RepID=A0A0H3FHT1_RAHSY|nr:hypothetical protein [Rahnella aceris]ADW75811.1 hypothetical protein Rahaq_4223 [Rahnella aceris]AFE60500.1 hypothetical protein Q7S_21475 [Rahnella aquatilis HX2]MBU9862649.1 hypothetical protein [Rahnella aceris]